MLETYQNLIAVTNRHLCNNNLKDQIKKISQLDVNSIVLREKDMLEEDYFSLASDCIKICNLNNTKLILHNFIDTAIKLNHPYIHLPLNILEKYRFENKYCEFLDNCIYLGTSTHSIEDVKKAENLGCTYVFCGNIYETDCKKGLPGKGLDFLSEICKKTSLPVYAIGGINTDRLSEVLKVGASGGCMMSGFMKY